MQKDETTRSNSASSQRHCKAAMSRLRNSSCSNKVKTDSSVSGSFRLDSSSFTFEAGTRFVSTSIANSNQKEGKNNPTKSLHSDHLHVFLRYDIATSILLVVVSIYSAISSRSQTAASLQKRKAKKMCTITFLLAS